MPFDTTSFPVFTSKEEILKAISQMAKEGAQNYAYVMKRIALTDLTAFAGATDDAMTEAEFQALKI